MTAFHGKTYGRKTSDIGYETENKYKLPPNDPPMQVGHQNDNSGIQQIRDLPLSDVIY